VLVTGHTGFKGSWLSLWLQELGAVVTGYALAPATTPSLFELARVGSCMGSASKLADVRDAVALAAALDAAQPDVVFHLAAQALVRDSYIDPIGTYATNVMGTANVLEAVRRHPSVKAVVVVTSDKCYENREWAWGYRETEALGGHDPYSSSKACAELVTQAYRRSFFQPDAHPARLATARAGNVIGGGDWAKDRLVPDVLSAFAAGRPVALRHPHATRPWQHVLEPLSGYLLLAERLTARAPGVDEAFNLGPSDEGVQTVQQVVDGLAQRWGGDVRWELSDGQHPHEAGLLKLDIAKARAVLGWKPQLSFEEALHWTVDWYRAHGDGADARQLSLAQIRLFSERLQRRDV
jgi:CDP-glucose 4,6-dehydratase